MVRLGIVLVRKKAISKTSVIVPELEYIGHYAVSLSMPKLPRHRINGVLINKVLKAFQLKISIELSSHRCHTYQHRGNKHRKDQSSSNYEHIESIYSRFCSWSTAVLEILNRHIKLSTRFWLPKRLTNTSIPVPVSLCVLTSGSDRLRSWLEYFEGPTLRFMKRPFDRRG